MLRKRYHLKNEHKNPAGFFRWKLPSDEQTELKLRKYYIHNNRRQSFRREYGTVWGKKKKKEGCTPKGSGVAIIITSHQNTDDSNWKYEIN